MNTAAAGSPPGRRDRRGAPELPVPRAGGYSDAPSPGPCAARWCAAGPARVSYSFPAPRDPMNRRLRPASSRPARAAALAACLALASLAVVPARDVSAQDLPVIPPPGGCRSELDARLAFGLCRDSTFDFYASGEYRQGIPRPEEVLGYPIGSWHTTYGRMEKYIAALAEAAPERVRVFDYGRSVEGQVMHLIAVSAERHIGRLEQIRAGLARLADPRATTRAEAEALIQDLPVVVWLNAANDGNETA